MTLVFLALGAFLLGSVPPGLLLARARGVDIRTVGSGNIGATNVGRALGRIWAVVVLVLDALKGAVPVLAARALLPVSDRPLGAALAGFCAVLGHVFSIFLRGRGGKGVATTLGAALALAPLPALACAGLYLVLFAAFRISSVGSLAAVIAFPIILALTDAGDRPALGFGIAVAVLVVVRHKDNLRRLVRGEELKA